MIEATAEMSILESTSTNVVASPIPTPLIAEVVVPKVGHIPKTKEKVGLSLMKPFVIKPSLLILVLLSLLTLVYVKESIVCIVKNINVCS